MWLLRAPCIVRYSRFRNTSPPPAPRLARLLQSRVSKKAAVVDADSETRMLSDEQREGDIQGEDTVAFFQVGVDGAAGGIAEAQAPNKVGKEDATGAATDARCRQTPQHAAASLDPCLEAWRSTCADAIVARSTSGRPRIDLESTPNRPQVEHGSIPIRPSAKLLCRQSYSRGRGGPRRPARGGCGPRAGGTVRDL